MASLFAVLGLIVLAFGIWLILSALYRLARGRISGKAATKRVLSGLIIAPVASFAIIAVGFTKYPPDPESARQHAEERALVAAERAQASAERAQADRARREAEAAERAEADRIRREAERAAASQADAACRASLQCWGDRHHVEASVRCRRPVERLANYSMEWTDGFLESKFSRFRWSPLGNGILVYIGDTARFQNGFGAWQNVIYECTYDPASERVIDATARPGRL